MTDKKIALVDNVGGDWMGLYIDGELVDEGETLSAGMVLEHIGVEHEQYLTRMQGGNLPANFDDLNLVGHCEFCRTPLSYQDPMNMTCENVDHANNIIKYVQANHENVASLTESADFGSFSSREA